VIALRAACAAALATALLAGCGGAQSTASTTAGSPARPAAQSSTATSPTATSTTAASPTTTSTSAARATATTRISATTAISTTATLAGGFHLSSPAFGAGEQIPTVFTCDGSNISPPLQITGVPNGTRELVLVMRDADAPGGGFVHWALAGIPPTIGDLPSGGVPGLVSPGVNSFGTLGYRGPCPPPGDPPHHYVLSLSALSTTSGLSPGFRADQLRSTAIGIATLIGTYVRR
jgi:Raf kinase inhibitor-like YbhB/YbcL family protein